MKQNYTLKALQQFQCLAGDCPNHCCHTYDVAIEQSKITSWQQSENRETLMTFIEKPENSEHYIFKHKPDCDCIAILDSGLCSIQQQFGHEALPHICQVYPRYKKENSWRQLSSLALSCPEVVSLTLLRNKDGAAIEGIGKSAKNSVHFSNAFQQASMQLDEMTREVMNLDKFPINVKLFHLGNVLSELYRAVDANQANANLMAQLFGQPKQKLYDINMAHKQRRIKLNPVTAGSIWHLLFKFYCDNVVKSTNIDITKSELFQFADKTFSNNEEFEEFHQVLSTYADKSRAEIRKRYGDVFNNYLKISFLNWGFPWEPMMENHVAGFLCVYIPFTIIQILLWTKYAETGCLDDEYVIETIYTVERICGHSDKMLAMLSNNTELLQLDAYKDCLIESF